MKLLYAEDERPLSEAAKTAVLTLAAGSEWALLT